LGQSAAAEGGGAAAASDAAAAAAASAASLSKVQVPVRHRAEHSKANGLSRSGS
jgi:hypothetical protein